MALIISHRLPKILLHWPKSGCTAVLETKKALMAQTKRAWLSRSLAIVGSTVLRIVASMADRSPEMQKPGKMAQKRQSYFAVGGGLISPGEMAVVEEEVSETRAVSPEGGDGEMSATGADEGIVMGGLAVSAIAWILLPDMLYDRCCLY